MYKFRGVSIVRITMVLVFVMGTMLALSVSPGWSITQAPKNVLVITSTDEITTWDPSAAFSTESSYMPNLYEGLLRSNPPGAKKPFEPLLAKDWDVSEDGLTWTFYLREGVKFHDGEPFNAQAVKYSIERTIKMGMGAAFIFDPVKEIKVVDDYTVRFTLKYPAPFATIVASANAAWIMSPKVAEHDRDGDMGRGWLEEGHVVGTGPYTLESWKPGEEIVFKKFDNYWGGWEGPHFDKIIVKISHEAVVFLEMLLAGEADLVTLVPLESVSTVEADPNCEVLRGPSFINYYIHLNTAVPPFNNKLVRQAVSYALPYRDIVKVGAAGYGRQAVGPIPYGEFGHNEYLYQYHQDLDKARKLMAMAGYPDGVDRTLIYTYAAQNSVEATFSPLVKEALAKIGIDIEIRPMIWTSQWELMKSGPKGAQDLAAVMWWPTMNDPYDTLYSLWYSEEKPYWNFAYYKNPEFDQLIDEAYRTTGVDREKAAGLYSKAQQILIMDAPSAFLFDAEIGVYKRVDLKGYIINPSYPRVAWYYYMYKE